LYVFFKYLFQLNEEKVERAGGQRIHIPLYFFFIFHPFSWYKKVSEVVNSYSSFFMLAELPCLLSLVARRLVGSCVI